MSATPYEQLGGDLAVRQLVDRFYDLMDTAPEAAHIRALHAKSLKVSRDKLYKYFSGWMGGPPLYESEYGHPRLRMRHFPFPIGARERDEWLWCMERALSEQPMPDDVRVFLMGKLRALADHMRNQPEFGDGPVTLHRG
jgi:hemoglobin